MKINRSKPRGILNKVLVGLLVLAAASGASLGAAYVWQRAQEQTGPEISHIGSQSDADPTPSNSTSPESSAHGSSSQPDYRPSTSAPEVSSVSGSLSSSSSPPLSSSQSGVASQDPGNLPPPVSSLPGALAESPRVDNSYFSDALFIGDSISTGIPLYQVAGSPDTVAVKGLSPLNITTNAVVPSSSGSNITVLEAAKQYGEKKKVYIMLGSNALWMDIPTFTSEYKTFIQALKEQYPGAVIYLQTLPPVTVKAREIYSTADNEVILQFNSAIAEIATSTRTNLVDVHCALVDSDGNLPLEASPNDGMHLTPEYYQKWFDYLKTHTVEEKQ